MWLRIDRPALLFSCVSMVLALGIASYSSALKARLDTEPTSQVTSVQTVSPSATPTPSVTPSPSPTPTPVAPTPAAKPSTQKVVTYVTRTAPESSVSSLQPHTSAPAASSSPAASGSSAPATAAVSYTSSNWSGYLATGSSYTSVSGSWTVPSPTGNGTNTSHDAAWVGIGGVTSDDLIQAGTLNSVSANGQVTVYAFYEILPAPARLITSMTVSPGDTVSASVTEIGTNLWQIIVTDQTTGQTFTKNLSYTSTHSSAEWIEEDPSDSSGNLLPFARFGNIAFTGGTTTASGGSFTIAGIGAQPITMLSGGAPVATPSAVAGGSFTVTRSGP